MPKVTDSFCERCGNRYVFSAGAPKALSLRGARALAKGLKNFVLTDGQSMSDAISMARLEDVHHDSARVDDAFHKTFNFCMTCRQYACDRCWNSTVGACLSCAPEPDAEPVAPEEFLVVGTPVAPWEGDWSLAPDSPAVEPPIPAAPTSVEGRALPRRSPGPREICQMPDRRRSWVRVEGRTTFQANRRMAGRGVPGRSPTRSRPT